ncbi:hypothetical protein ACJMK2_012730 [Sinanodonta woodiana]|uniref:P2X purinoreceptor 7 intracellular domain-containing protein n=1 Tax=Sinanodonta woodiana TaxID=1069815 RepID=A0ABD3V961_SINWO
MEGKLLDETIENDFTVQPYMYEPMPANNEQEAKSSDSESDEMNSEQHGNVEVLVNRDGNVEWCLCNNCHPMETQLESICCKEYDELQCKLESVSDCITQHEGFMGNCLNPDVIEVSFYEFLQANEPMGDEEPVHELAKHDRRVLTACTVNAIRTRFPSENYKGFEYARDF